MVTSATAFAGVCAPARFGGMIEAQAIVASPRLLGNAVASIHREFFELWTEKQRMHR